MDRVKADPAIVAAVLVSGKRDSFVVGADINLVRRVRFAAEAERISSDMAARYGRLGALGKPVVAAVHGQALGGGFELALACRAIVVSDDPKTCLGLPDAQLGLLPGANGLLRVAERAGLRVAIDLGLTGKTTRAAKAVRLGLADEVCPRAVLVEVAASRAKALAAGSSPQGLEGGRTSARSSGSSSSRTPSGVASSSRRLARRPARRRTGTTLPPSGCSTSSSASRREGSVRRRSSRRRASASWC